MKLTKSRIRQIIQEELAKVMSEYGSRDPYDRPSEAELEKKRARKRAMDAGWLEDLVKTVRKTQDPYDRPTDAQVDKRVEEFVAWEREQRETENPLYREGKNTPVADLECHELKELMQKHEDGTLSGEWVDQGYANEDGKLTQTTFRALRRALKKCK